MEMRINKGVYNDNVLMNLEYQGLKCWYEYFCKSLIYSLNVFISII